MKTISFIALFLFSITTVNAEDGHQLWLRSKKAVPVTITCARSSATIAIAKQELNQGWQGKAGASVVLTIKGDKAIKGDGFRLTATGVSANTDLGILYGVYELLRRQKTGQSIKDEVINPSYEIRILDHWDNLNGSIERGYAGPSIFWHKDSSLEVTNADKTIWNEYARANASVGINAAVLNNVNASPSMLSAP